MAWSVLTWLIMRIFQSYFLFEGVCAKTRHKSYTRNVTGNAKKPHQDY